MAARGLRLGIRIGNWGDPITRDLRDFEAESIMEVTHILCFFVKM